MFGYILLTPLIVCLVTPQYLILSMHNSFTKYIHGNISSNLFWPTIGIIIGLFVSNVLLKYVLGTFLILSLGLVIFTVCCIGLFLISLTQNAIGVLAYKYIIIVSGFGIGMTQPNLAAFFGDQFQSNSIQHYYLYVFIQMMGICLAVAAPLMIRFNLIHMNCLAMNCYSLLYLMCVILSGMGCLLLVPIYFMPIITVFKPLVFAPHSSDNDNNLNRLQIFASITIPLINIFLVAIIIERELWSQAKHLNRVVQNFSLQEIHLHVIFSCMPIICVPLGMVVALVHTNGFVKITISSFLISVASFYLEHLHTCAADDYYKPYVVGSHHMEYQVYNGCGDISFHLKMEKVTRIAPFQEKIGPFPLNANIMNLTFTVKDISITDSKSKEVTFNFTLPNKKDNRGKLLSNFYTPSGMILYEERNYRLPTGLVLLRLLLSSKKKVCLQSQSFRKCFRQVPNNNTLMEIPPGLYTFTYTNIPIGKYFLNYGAYYTMMFVEIEKKLIIIPYAEIEEKNRQILTPFVIIPPHTLSILWHSAIYVLMSMAKVMLYAGGLDVAYLIATDEQKSLFISCLYSFYFVALFFNILIFDLFHFQFNTSLDLIAFMAFLSTGMIYTGHRFWSHLLNRKE